LKLRLLANTFRRSPWQLAGLLIGIVYGLTLSATLVIAFVSLRLVPVDIAAPVVIVFGSLISAGFVIVPLVSGVDDTLDPRKFALFGIPTSTLAWSLAVAALVSIPAVVAVFLAASQVVTWGRSPLATAVALISAVLIVVGCVLGARVSTSIAAFVLNSRRARDIIGLVAVIGIVSLSPSFALMLTIDWERDGLLILAKVADVASLTPLGAAWAAPAAAAAGELGAATKYLGIAAAYAAALAIGWRMLVGAMLTRPQRMVRARRYSGLGWFAVLPTNRTGVVLARSLTYWARDARYRISLIVIPIVPVLVAVPLAVGGVPLEIVALLPVPAMAMFLSWSIHNDVAFDSTAFWLHVASEVPGTADRLGRAIPALALGLPLVVGGSAIAAIMHGDIDIVWSIMGVSTCILLVGLGLSCITSARFPYPAAQPGDSPFAQPQVAGAAASLIQSFSFFAVLVLAVPAAALAAYGFLVDPAFHLWSLAAGLGVGTVVFATGVLWGGRIVERRGPELLAFTLRN